MENYNFNINMLEFDFWLFSTSPKERFAFYYDRNGSKVIDNFHKISYTVENLLDDILDGFSGYSLFKDSTNEAIVSIGNLAEAFIKVSYDIWDESLFFDNMIYKVVHMSVNEKSVCLEFNPSKMNENETIFFGKFKDELEKYCDKNNVFFLLK